MARLHRPSSWHSPSRASLQNLHWTRSETPKLIRPPTITPIIGIEAGNPFDIQIAGERMLPCDLKATTGKNRVGVG